MARELRFSTRAKPIDDALNPTALGFQRWWDGTDLSKTTISSGVSAWAPTTGTGTWAQGTAGRRPAQGTVVSKYNGLNVIIFDNTDDNLTLSGEDVLPVWPWTIAYVGEIYAAQATKYFLAAPRAVGGQYLHLEQPSNRFGWELTSADASPGSAGILVPHVGVITVSAGGAVSIYVNGVLFHTGTATGTVPSGAPSAVTLGGAQSTDGGLSLRLAEIAVKNSVLSAGELASYTSYARSKFGI